MSADHDHEHHDEYRPSEISLRVKAIESLLVEKKLLDPVAVDKLVDAYENKIGPHNGARVVAPNGRVWTPTNIGGALAGRELARHLRELGVKTRGPAALTKADRSRFLSALDTAVQKALREAPS